MWEAKTAEGETVYIQYNASPMLSWKPIVLDMQRYEMLSNHGEYFMEPDDGGQYVEYDEVVRILRAYGIPIQG